MLISPRHVIHASHTVLNVGDVLTWLGSDSVLHSATVASGGSVAGTDISIVYLSAALPSSCKPANIFPSSTFATSGACAIPAIGIDQNLGISGLVNVPLMHANQNQEVLLLDWLGWGNASADALCNAPIETSRMAWGTSPASGISGIYSGDSDSPVFTVLPGDVTKTPVLVFVCHTTAGGPNISNNIAAVQALMNSLGGSYTLSQADISGFPTY